MASASGKKGTLYSYFDGSGNEKKEKSSKPRVQSGPLRHSPSSKPSRYSPVSSRRAETTPWSVPSESRSGKGGRGRDSGSATYKGGGTSSSASAAAATRLPTSLDFSEVQGDLFSCPPSSSLAHCVSEDMAMGKGVAVLFKKEFGRVGILKAQGVKPGGVAVLEHKGRFIYYLVTKKRSFHKPTYESLRSSLEAMKAHCVSNEVKELCMPRIGCGLDRLDWGQVTVMICSIFSDCDMKITIYYL